MKINIKRDTTMRITPTMIVGRKAYMNTINNIDKMSVDEAIKQGFEAAVNYYKEDFPLSKAQKNALWKKHLTATKGLKK